MTKKVISAVLTAVMVFSVFAVTPYVDDGKAYAATLKAKATTEIYVRKGAGPKYLSLGMIEKDHKFSVYGVKKGTDGDYWYRTKFDSKRGYVSSKYAVRVISGTKTITAKKGTVTADGVNLRLGPSTDYPVVAEVSAGRKFTADGKNTNDGTWYRVSYDGLKVYVSGNYFSLSKSGTSSTTKKTTKKTTKTTQPTTTVPENANDNLFVKAVAKESGNVRKGAGTNYGKLGVLYEGDTTKITGVQKDSEGVYWYKIKFNKKTGFIKNTYLTRKGYKSTSIDKKKFFVTKNGVNVRLGPGTKYPIVFIANAGKAFTVDGKADDSEGTKWYRATHNGIKVYVNSKFLSKNKADVEKSSTTTRTTTKKSSTTTKKSTTTTTTDPNAPKITLEAVTYPKNVTKGEMFTLSGKVKCEKNMTKVVAGIQSAEGKWLDGYKIAKSVNTRSYDLEKNVDEDIKFGKLEAGSYKYVCRVTTSYGTVTAFNRTFKIVAAPSITVSGLTYPTTLSQYKGFTLKGTVKSNEPITSLRVGITTRAGAWKKGFNFTAKPNTKTYDLDKMDDKIIFGNLGTGSYCYRCEVKTATVSKTLFNYGFVVNKNTGIPQTLPYGKLTGNKKNDIVQIALAQAGYTTNRENHTAYNLWYYGSDTSAAWCAIFVSWCANQAGVSTGKIPKMAYVPSVTAWYKSKGRFNAKSTPPKKGDLIIYAGSCHIGIVTEDSTNGYVSTIEGNTGNDEAKYRKNYMRWNSGNIQGYCHPNYQ